LLIFLRAALDNREHDLGNVIANVDIGACELAAATYSDGP